MTLKGRPTKMLQETMRMSPVHHRPWTASPYPGWRSGTLGAAYAFPLFSATTHPPPVQEAGREVCPTPPCLNLCALWEQKGHSSKHCISSQERHVGRQGWWAFTSWARGTEEEG